MSEVRVFQEENRHVRMGVANYSEELLALFADKVVVCVRYIVENEDGRVFH